MYSKEFHKQLTEVLEKFKITDEEAATVCRVATGTIRRWKEGDSSPHPYGMLSVIEALKQLKKQ